MLKNMLLIGLSIIIKNKYKFLDLVHKYVFNNFFSLFAQFFNKTFYRLPSQCLYGGIITPSVVKYLILNEKILGGV